MRQHAAGLRMPLNINDILLPGMLAVGSVASLVMQSGSADSQN
jgi:hypothetical protein